MKIIFNPVLIIRFIKYLLKTNYHKYLIEINYAKFNRKTDNQIASFKVDLSSIKGNHIKVMSDSFIDKKSNIGSYTYIGYNCFITKADIGCFCSIANNVSIGGGEHDLSKISTQSIFYNESYEQLTKDACTIGNDVWIGTGCIIKRGVKIGNGAVVGANSFVNKDVPDFAVVGGSPAKVLKYRFSEPQRIEIIKSEWWNFNLPEAKETIKELTDKIEKIK